MSGVAALQRKLSAYLPEDSLRDIDKAYRYSSNAHLGQVRASGKPYIQHPLAVADILADWSFGGEAIQAALLHDVVEDTPVSIQQVREAFGGTVALLVDGLSKIDRIEGIDRRAQEAETFRKILVAAADDWRVMFIKLADRLHNMRTLGAIGDTERRQRIARETLNIYAPIAERMGFSPLSDELQNLSFRCLHPHRYRVLSKALNNSKANSRNVIGRTEKAINEALAKYQIVGNLAKRRKNLHSIYDKMEKQRLSFAQVEDLIGFRLIVNDRITCYLALGALHEKFTPVPTRFKDYIAMPKSNGYQSLHTALITREQIRVEIQIRTASMHEVAEHGLAAHWRYKTPPEAVEDSQSEALKRLSSLVQLHAENTAPGEFMEYVKVELSPGEIYVLTRDGDAVSLPAGATALDFAYAIHSDIGNHAEKAEVNGAIMPISTRLRSGDHVEVKANEHIMPLPHWLNFAKTARARSHIRHKLSTISHKDSASLGQKLLKNALLKISDEKPDDIAEEHWRSFLGANNMKQREDLYAALGMGKVMPDIAARGLLRRRVRQDKNAKLRPLLISGAGSAAIKLPSCCYPLPFESIVGIMQKNHGLVVHADRCPMAQTAPGRRFEKWIDAAWSDKAAGVLHHSAISLECRNRAGLAAVVSSTISNLGVNMVTFNFSAGALTHDSIQMETIVEVPSLAELERLLSVLRTLPDVIEAKRRWQVPEKS